MKRPPDNRKDALIGHGSVSTNEVLSLREAGRRLGLASRALCDCQRQGLRTILCGRVKYVLGSDVLAFFQQLRDKQQVNDELRGGNEGQ